MIHAILKYPGERWLLTCENLLNISLTGSYVRKGTAASVSNVNKRDNSAITVALCLKKMVEKRGNIVFAAGCTSSYKDDVSLRGFPNAKRAEIRKQWAKCVKVKRKNFDQPFQYSVLCERHFTADSYPREYEIKRSMGLHVPKKCILPHAVPTIHATPVPVFCPL